jgi:hypothetical protein
VKHFDHFAEARTEAPSPFNDQHSQATFPRIIEMIRKNSMASSPIPSEDVLLCHQVIEYSLYSMEVSC